MNTENLEIQFQNMALTSTYDTQYEQRHLSSFARGSRLYESRAEFIQGIIDKIISLVVDRYIPFITLVP